MSRKPSELWTAEADALALKLGRLLTEREELLERLRDIDEDCERLKCDAKALRLTKTLADYLDKQ